MATPCFHHDRLGEGLIELSPEEARHVAGARRLRVGDALRLLDGRGHTADAVVQALDRRILRVHVTGVHRVAPGPMRRLSLLTALPKGSRKDYLFEKCTELGVGGIVAVNFARSVTRVGMDPQDGWQRTCIEAAKQSGQAWVPKLSTAESVVAAVATLPVRAVRLVAEPSGSAAALPDTIQQAANAPIAVVIGPEGGLTAEELLVLERRGFIPIRLGEAILRIETACVAAAVRVQAALEATDGP